MTDWSSYREIADAGGRMPFNAAAIRSMLDEIDRLRAEREDARRWAVHLEGLLAREQAKVRSAEILCERAEGDRDRALQRLATCAAEAAAFRQQRDEAIRAVTALCEAIDADLCDERPAGVAAAFEAADAVAQELVERYRRPAPAIIDP